MCYDKPCASYNSLCNQMSVKGRPVKLSRAELLDLVDTEAIINKVVKHCKATDDLMTANQLKGAEMLLRRTLPEIRISAPTQESDFDGDPANVTNAQLAAIIASASSDHAPREKASKDKPGKVRQIH